MKRTIVGCVLGVAVAVAIGCGGDSSGIDRSKAVGSLSAADQMTECMNNASKYPSKTVMCSDGSTLPLGTDPAECSGSGFHAYPAACPVTVGQAEDCEAALYAAGSAACGSGSPPAACAAVFANLAACTPGGSGG
jgi:hypothetical protein